MQIAYKVSFLRNLGNFENTNVEVGIIDEPRGGETFEDAYKRIKSKVEEKLMESVIEMEQELSEDSRKDKAKGK